MKKFITVLFCVALSLASSKAANIAYISFHGADDAPSTDAATAGFTQAPDVGYTQLLAANGHTVTRFLTKDNPTVDDANTYNSFDLVIISRSVNSGNYQDATTETPFWNTAITKPIINMGGYTLRNSRLNFTTGGNMPDTTSDISLQALVPGHPVFAGIALDGNNIMVNSFAGIATFNSTTQRGISINSDPLAGGGTLIGVIGTGTVDTGVLGTGLVIAEWGAGAVLGNGNVLGGNRMVFLSGSREQGITSQGAGIFDLSADGSAMFLNAVTYMTVPEPSTYILLGFGALALLLRRKKA